MFVTSLFMYVNWIFEEKCQLQLSNEFSVINSLLLILPEVILVPWFSLQTFLLHRKHLWWCGHHFCWCCDGGVSSVSAVHDAAPIPQDGGFAPLDKILLLILSDVGSGIPNWCLMPLQLLLLILLFFSELQAVWEDPCRWKCSREGRGYTCSSDSWGAHSMGWGTHQVLQQRH